LAGALAAAARHLWLQEAWGFELGLALLFAGLLLGLPRFQWDTDRVNAAQLKPVHDWVKTFERYWTHQLGQIKERAERKALERMISSDIIKKED
jgi:hypothetical protein